MEFELLLILKQVERLKIRWTNGTLHQTDRRHTPVVFILKLSR